MAELRVPEEALAAEIEFAITYIWACDPMPADFRPDRLARLISGMILERAGNGISGMTLG